MGGNNALLYTCSSSIANEEIVNYLILEAGVDFNSTNDYSMNCLLMTTKRANERILKLLLKKDADLCFKDKNGCNALHIACASGHIHIVHLILLHDHKMRLKRKKLMLQHNHEHKHDDKHVEADACNKFSIDSKDNKSSTPLMKAAMNKSPKHQEIV